MKNITPQTHSPEEFQLIRNHQANGMGGLPLVGDPDWWHGTWRSWPRSGSRASRSHSSTISTSCRSFAPRCCRVWRARSSRANLKNTPRPRLAPLLSRICRRLDCWLRLLIATGTSRCDSIRENAIAATARQISQNAFPERDVARRGASDFFVPDRPRPCASAARQPARRRSAAPRKTRPPQAGQARISSVNRGSIASLLRQIRS